ncbi:MAG: hypothetical protein ABIJ36_01410 [Patescibacteria group bacterium]
MSDESIKLKAEFVLDEIFLKDIRKCRDADDIWRALVELGNPLKIKKKEIPALIKSLVNRCYLVRIHFSRKYRPSDCIGTRLPPPSPPVSEGEWDASMGVLRIPAKKPSGFWGGGTTFVGMSEGKYD